MGNEGLVAGFMNYYKFTVEKAIFFYFTKRFQLPAYKVEAFVLESHAFDYRQLRAGGSFELIFFVCEGFSRSQNRVTLGAVVKLQDDGPFLFELVDYVDFVVHDGHAGV